jgi:opacity protein-like surface antigen
MFFMKKIFTIAALLTFCMSAYAQAPYDKAIGLRLGSSVGATYKQFISNTNAIEAIVDLDLLDNDALKLNLTGMYLWQWNISGADGLSWYVGPGVSVGTRIGDNPGFNLGFDGMIGLEYKFNIPLSLSLDFNPRLYIIDGTAWSTGGALSVRYCF